MSDRQRMQGRRDGGGNAAALHTSTTEFLEKLCVKFILQHKWTEICDMKLGS